MNELKEIRESRGLSQFQLSMLSGVNQSNISRIERGVESPTLNTLEKLARSMGLKLVIEFREKTE